MKKKLLIIGCILLTLILFIPGVYFLIEGHGGFHMLFGRTLDLTEIMSAETFTHEDGTVLPYRIYVPQGEALPLVLSLHGSGGRGDNNRAQIGGNSIAQVLLTDENRAQFPAVVLAPQCPAEQNWADVSAAVMGLLEQVLVTYPIDPARVYVTGYSMGGHGTWHMLAQYPEFFAAAVPICGWGTPDYAYRFANLPIWVFHGRRDPTVSVQASRDMIDALQAVGAPHLRYTEYWLERHMSWYRAHRESELLPWLFAQTR